MAANAWIELFRNMPLLVQLFLWYFVFPDLLPAAWGIWLKQLPNAPFLTSVIGIGFFMSARVAVQVASGIEALPAGGGGLKRGNPIGGCRLAGHWRSPA